jgi:hypothetical protein
LDQDLELQEALQESARKEARIRDLEAALSEASRRHDAETSRLRAALVAQEAEVQRLSSECGALQLDLERARAHASELEETFHQGVAADGIDLLAGVDSPLLFEGVTDRKEQTWAIHDEDKRENYLPYMSSQERAGGERGSAERQMRPQVSRSPRRPGSDLAESFLRPDAGEKQCGSVEQRRVTAPRQDRLQRRHPSGGDDAEWMSMPPPRAPAPAQTAVVKTEERVRVPSKSSTRRAAPPGDKGEGDDREVLFRSPRRTGKAREASRESASDLDSREALEMGRSVVSKVSASIESSEVVPALVSRGGEWLSGISGGGIAETAVRRRKQDERERRSLAASLSEPSFRTYSSASVRAPRPSDNGAAWERNHRASSPGGDSAPSKNDQGSSLESLHLEAPSQDRGGGEGMQRSPRAPSSSSSMSGILQEPRRSVSGMASIFRFGIHGNAAAVVPI